MFVSSKVLTSLILKKISKHERIIFSPHLNYLFDSLHSNAETRVEFLERQTWSNRKQNSQNCWNRDDAIETREAIHLLAEKRNMVL